MRFGEAVVKTDFLRVVGSQPPADSTLPARLITPLSSDSARQGQKVEAIVSRPLFSPDHRLILPEGTHITGAVTLAHRARWFHRGGQLRFNFQRIDLPEGLAPRLSNAARLVTDARGTVFAAESSGKTEIKVDEEGGVKATEPKTRFIAPAIAALIAMKSMDNDEGRTGVHEGNPGGRTLGGISGLGLAGAAVSQASPVVGKALGLYGLAWSVFSNVVSRGGEVEFAKNAAIDIRFGSRVPAPASKFRQETAHNPARGPVRGKL